MVVPRFIPKLSWTAIRLSARVETRGFRPTLVASQRSVVMPPHFLFRAQRETP